MICVQLASLHLGPWIYRQPPQNDGIWQNMLFQVEASDPDWLVVFDVPPSGLKTSLPKERRLLVVSEPPEVQRFSKDYLGQFGVILSSYELADASGRCVVRPSCLPWFFGRQIGRGTGHKKEPAPNLLWDELVAPPPLMADRDIEISAICSTKAVTLQQVRRLRFLKLLKATLGHRLHLFGRGFHEIDDKSDIIRRSRYHLALENSEAGLFWSEKLADPILGGAYPIHAGAKSTTSLFHQGAILHVDLKRPREAVKSVVDLLARNPVAAGDLSQILAANRELVMHRYNLFAELHRLISERQGVSNHTADRIETVAITRPAKPASARLNSALKGVNRLIWRLQIAALERA